MGHAIIETGDKMKTKTKVLLAATTVAATATAYYGICEVVYNKIIRRNRKDFIMLGDANLDDQEKLIYKQNQGIIRQWYTQSDTQDVMITSFDGLRLHAISINNHPKSDKWAILVHGYSADGLDMLSRAKEFDQRNFNVLLVDCRGHGLSEGHYIGMGWQDRHDVLEFAKYIKKQHESAKIVLYGLSMGASAIMMACADISEDSGIICAIEDCGFSSVKDILSYQIKQKLNVPAMPILIGLNTLIKMRCHYSLFDGSATQQLQSCQVPMMFIHGEDDQFVPYDMVFDNYYACTAEKELYTVAGAKHAQAEYNLNYYERVFRFIERYMK